jgi:S1-C subfamily serine protease
MRSSKQSFVRTTRFWLGALAVGCGGSHPAPTVASPSNPTASSQAAVPSPAPRDVRERIVPHTCAARTRLAQLLGHTTAPPAPPSEQSPDSAPPPPTSLAGAARMPGTLAYRAVAPATVLITSERSMGTGVVIDPKGYVLTNYHVVADGRMHDFVVTVGVTFGELTAAGRMHRLERSHDAVVVKTDVVRDLAILKVSDPPPHLQAVKLAKSAPQVAEKVISVGHAGIGFLWAAKTCSVASVGERQQDMSRLAALDCLRSDPASAPEEAKRYKTRCEDEKKQLTGELMSKTQGLAIQTDCAITHGDSGGPLVNALGELVGLNQSISADLATAAFHVHLDEIRDFTARHGDEGIAILPDPLCDGGFDPTLEDIDLDGVPDTLLTKGTSGFLGGYDRMSLLVDLDEDQFTGKWSSDTFDAEVALLVIRDAAYVWYDTDGDSKFDLLLVDKNNDGAPELAYRIDAAGRPKADQSALPSHDLSGKLVKDPAQRARLAKIASAIGGAKYISSRMRAASNTLRVPDPLLGGGAQGRLYDSDGNGKSDLAVTRATFSRGLLIDADEAALGALKPGDPADELVKAKKTHAEVSLIVQGNVVWALYDTDQDTNFDLALMTTHGVSPSFLTATNAWRLGRGGEMTPAPEQLGRKLLRPALVPLPRVAPALRLLSPDLAKDESLGSLPDPFSSAVGFRARALKGVPESTIVEAQGSSSSVLLVDLDHDTKLATKANLQEVVSRGKFDAEVAIVHHADDAQGSDWIYYDTDNDGTFDLVLFVAASGQDPVQAYRVPHPGGQSGAALQADPNAVAGRPLRHASVFKDRALAAKWKGIANQLFKSTSIEP